MPFCYSPWTNIDISPQGDIAPCCKFTVSKYNERFNIARNNIDEYRNSKMLTQIKQEFEQGQWPAGCERCQLEESHGVKSKRVLDAERWAEHYHSYQHSQGFITASVAFGNTCNLKCITCGPYSSSRWAQEHQDLFGHTIHHFKFYKENFVSDLTALAPNLVHIDIPGGEPFLSGVAEQKQLLQHYIDTNQAQNISIHYTTNVTTYPDEDWWRLWCHFRDVDIQLSLDGTEQRYEYIRYPATWAEVSNNIKRYQQQCAGNIRLSVSHTLSAYNVYYLDEFFDWCYTNNLPTPWVGRVHRPEPMRPTVWPDTTRQMIADKLKNSQYPEVQTWANVLESDNDSDQFDQFRQRVIQHDQYRGTDFAQTFPEMAKYL